MGIITDSKGEKWTMHDIPGRKPGEKGITFRSLTKLQNEAKKAQSYANYTKSPLGMTVNTIKGMPQAAGKILQEVAKRIPMYRTMQIAKKSGNKRS